MIAVLSSLVFITAASIFKPYIQYEPSTANVDFSGVEQFLELTALLEKDQEPTPEQWEALFATPGYAVLTKREFRRDFLIDRFKLAFMPSKKADLEAKLKEEKGFWAQFLPHYVRARKERKQIEDYVAKLKTMAFVREAVDQARVFLPEFEIKEYPPVAFVIFGPDARGYTPVVLDVLHTFDEKDFMATFIAHEFHHYYRNHLFDYEQEYDILWVINQVQAEGIADQVNVGQWFHDEELRAQRAQDKRNKTYLEWYDKSPQILREMDRLFDAMYDHPKKKAELGIKLRELVPLSGHPTGFYMSNLIIEQLAKETLVQEAGNPFAFFRLYKQAADKKGGETPTFSEKSMRFIRSMEEKYVH